ncbi:MAG TPA: VrrA/YqfQ family protein [Pseudogracilibacillus sp.]|nr:VrrA/YqfQ family protein [Pseudogracilibacillus sp.]
MVAYGVLERGANLSLESMLVKCNEYLMKAIIYIEKVLKVIISTGPYLEEYGPMIQQFSVLYHLMRVINEDKNEEGKTSTKDELETDTTPLPTLYI